MSKKTFAGQVKNYMKSHTKRRRMRVVMSVLSAFTALCVFGSLMRPAISMEKYNPLLTAEAENAVFGDLLTAHISAVAENENENTVFYLTTDQVSVVFDEDTVSFNEQDTARINTKKGNTISLHRVLDEDGAEAYWFELAPGESEEFDLTYTSESILIGELDEDGNVVSAGSQTTDVTGTAGGSISTGSGSSGGSGSAGTMTGETGETDSKPSDTTSGDAASGNTTDSENGNAENGNIENGNTENGNTESGSSENENGGNTENGNTGNENGGSTDENGNAESGSTGAEDNTENGNQGSSAENGTTEDSATDSSDTTDNSEAADDSDMAGDSDATGGSDVAGGSEDAASEADSVTVAVASIQKNQVAIHLATLSAMEESAETTEKKVTISTPSNGDIDHEDADAEEEESAKEESEKFVYEDPIEAYIIFYTGTGADIEEAKMVAQNAKKEETSALKLTWMTQEEYDALDDSQMIVTDMGTIPDGALSWATVEKEGYEPSADEQYGIMTLDLEEGDYGIDLAAEENGVDFGEYITNATVSKLVGNQWVPATEFTDDDLVKVEIHYTLPNDIVGYKNKTICYSLPAGVYPNENLTGFVYDASSVVGQYVIRTDGTIEIVFNDAFADNRPFMGTIEFQGTVSASEDNTENIVHFGGAGGSITIKPQEAQFDLSMDKTGTYDSKNNKINYTVTASSSKGTSGFVTITDMFAEGNDTTATYDKNSFEIIKVDADGVEETIRGYDVQIASDNSSFSITDLPKLGAGEKYVVTYSATPGTTTNSTGASSVKNCVRGTSGNNSGNKECTVEVAKNMISKSGNYQSSTGKIEWTITINPEKQDITGYKLTDQLTVNGENVTLPENVILKEEGENTGLEIPLPYTFPTSSNKTYTITYTTDAAAAAGQTVKNTASLTQEGKPGYQTSTDVTVPTRDYGVNKEFEHQDNTSTDTLLIYQWKSIISVPFSDVELDKLLYTDILSDAVLVSDNTTVISGSHYITPVQLGAMEVKLADNTLLVRDADYQIWDKDGQNIINDFTSQDHLAGFQVRFLDPVISKAAGMNIVLSYKTSFDLTKLTAGETYKVVNTGAIPGHEDSGETSYTPLKPFEKQASITGNSGDYRDDDLSVNYESSGGVLRYRLLVRVKADQNDPIVVTDVLPEGATLIKDENSVKVRFYENDNTEFDENWNGYSTSEQSSYDYGTTEDGKKKLVITINGGYNTTNPQARTFVIYYKLSIAEDWNNLESGEKEYINTASWGQNIENHKTTVDREIGNIAKAGTQIIGDNGELTNEVRYEIVINPLGEDLLANSDTIVLKDVLNSGNVGAKLLLDSVKLYRYDTTHEGTSCGEEISKDHYKYTYDSDSCTFTATLPDSTACVLAYKYLIERGNTNGNISISNNASLNGSESGSSSTNTSLKDNAHGATATKQELEIFKVDSDDYSKLLPGALFKVEGYTQGEDGGWKWNTIQEDLETDSNGKILLSPLGSETYAQNILYRLIETHAPENYLPKAEPYYFVWMESGSDKNATVQKMTMDALAGVETGNIRFISRSGTVITVPNDYTYLAVKKLWQDQSGNAISPPMDNINLKLYCQKQKLSACKVTVNLIDSTNGKTKTETLSIAKNSYLKVIIDGWNVEYTYNGNAFSSIGAAQAELSIEKVSGDEFTVNIYKNSLAHDVPSMSWSFEYNEPFQMEADGDRKEVEGVSPITLGASSSWQWSSNTLPSKDETGNTLYYFVEEADIPEGYKVTYLNNNGIQTGEIVVTNTSTSFTLPETGGRGTLPHCIIGTLLLLGSAIIMRRRRERLA